jgi:hypothetical protein
VSDTVSGPDQAVPTVFDETLNFAAYGTATATDNDASARTKLLGGVEGGISLALKPGLVAGTVATFSIDAPGPMNSRLTRAYGTIEYLSREGRGHVALGP